jgi:hypothetical protein
LRQVSGVFTLGEGSGNGRANATWYVGVLQDQLNAELNKNAPLRTSGYRAELRVWFTAGGSVERIELVKGMGDAQMDEVLRAALEAMPPLRRPPPPVCRSRYGRGSRRVALHDRPMARASRFTAGLEPVAAHAVSPHAPGGADLPFSGQARATFGALLCQLAAAGVCGCVP